MGIIGIILGVLAFGYVKYQLDTKDTSLQGYFEHLKKKYWDKGPKEKP